MNKIEINEGLLQESLMKYDAWAIILEDMIYLFDNLSSEDIEDFKKLIEWNIWDLIDFLKIMLEVTPNQEFYSYRLYETIYGIFYHLQNKWLVSEEDIKYLWKLIWIDYFPVSRKWIKDIKKQISHYTTFYLENWNNQKWILENKARQYYNIKDYQKAIELEHDIINNYWGNYENKLKLWSYYWSVGLQHTYDSQDFKAIPYIKKAIEMEPCNLSYYQELIAIYMEKQDYSMVIKYCIDFGVKNKWQNVFYLILWDAYLYSWRYEEAIKAYCSSEINEALIKKLKDLWDHLKHKKEFELAIQTYKEIIKIYPNYYYPYNQMWNVFFHQENYEAALLCFRKALSLEDWIAIIHNNVGFAYMYLWNYEEALSYINHRVFLLSKLTFLVHRFPSYSYIIWILEKKFFDFLSA